MKLLIVAVLCVLPGCAPPCAHREFLYTDFRVDGTNRRDVPVYRCVP
jgi:hypothetical protein